jgi:hypothetical protein
MKVLLTSFMSLSCVERQKQNQLRMRVQSFSHSSANLSPLADDDVLVDYARLLVDQYSVLNKRTEETIGRVRDFSMLTSMKRYPSSSGVIFSFFLHRIEQIQNAEGLVVHSSIEMLNSKVNRVHIATHSREVKQTIRSVLTKAGWEKQWDFPCDSNSQTPYGRATFQTASRLKSLPRVVTAKASHLTDECLTVGPIDRQAHGNSACDTTRLNLPDDAAQAQGRTN